MFPLFTTSPYYPLLFFLQQRKSPTQPGHFPATLFVFNGLALAEPRSHPNHLFPLHARSLDAIFTYFEPLPTAPFFSPVFPPQHTTSLKIIRGVGSFTGIFPGGVQAGPILGSGWASAGRMGATEGGQIG